MNFHINKSLSVLPDEVAGGLDRREGGQGAFALHRHQVRNLQTPSRLALGKVCRTGHIVNCCTQSVGVVCDKPTVARLCKLSRKFD